MQAVRRPRPVARRESKPVLDPVARGRDRRAGRRAFTAGRAMAEDENVIREQVIQEQLRKMEQEGAKNLVVST